MDSLKNLMKTFAKSLLKSKIVKIAIFLILVVGIILPSFVYYITIDDGTYKEGDWSSTSYVASTYTQNVTVGSDGITSNVTAQELWDKMIEEGANVQDYLDSPEELEKLMNAEIITQYPKIGAQNAKLDGIIEFERHKTDGTSCMLKYIDIDTFNKYIEERNTDIVNYFTLDESGNALIGVVNKTTETLSSNDSDMVLTDYTDTLSDADLINTGNYSKMEYSVTSQPIYYKNAVSKYTMPFQYLWILIVVSHDKGIGLELAELVEDSQIIISIYDNITTTVNTTINTYNREKKINVSATATAMTSKGDTFTKSGFWEPADEWEEEDEYEIKHVITYENDNLVFDITKADVWIVDYSKEYTYQASEQTSEEINEKNLEDTEYIDDADNPVVSENGSGSDLSYHDKFSDKLGGLVDELQRSVENQVIDSVTIATGITYCQASYYKHNVNRYEKNITTVSSQKYVAGNIVNNPKVEKKTEEQLKNGTGQDNFVTILCDVNHLQTRKKLTREVTSWLFNLLESNPDTVNMVEITRYLLNKVTDSDKFGEIDDTLLESLYGGSFNFEGTSIVNGDIDVSDESNFITDVETLKKAFSGYSNSAKLIEHAQDFLDMQEKYKVNALFAAAVSIAETGAGNAGNAIKIATAQNSVGATIGVSWNNWFNIKASSTPYGILYNGEGESHYKIYSTVSDSIDNFGNNIANGSYYYKQGKYTVNEIGHTYCPNSEAYPTQGDDWVEHTLTYINNFYSAAGITVETLTAGSFMQYYQGDYSNVPYGSSNLAACGCGPTSFAMISSTLLGQSITPEDAVSWCGNRYYVSNQGTSWSYFAAAASHFGLNVTVTQTSSINDAIRALKDGKYVISSQGPGLFTSGGHYIVLAGIDENNNITVKDPNKNNAVTKGYNNRTFTSTEINQAAKQYWIFN